MSLVIYIESKIITSVDLVYINIFILDYAIHF